MTTVRNAYIGIDACFAKGKRLPISICTWRDGRLVPEPLRRLHLKPPRGHGNVAVLDQSVVRCFAEEAKDYIVAACEALDVRPTRIAIDAPSAPRPEASARRAAERAMDVAGISCFTTPTASEFEAIRAKAQRHLQAGGPANRLPHANQLWMLVGFQLFEALASVAECIEVFPQAIVRVLGEGGVHKSKTGAVEAQLTAAARYTGWPGGANEEIGFSEIAWAPGHDRLDAYLSAWVAALEEGDRVAFGEAPNDVIWVPRLAEDPQFNIEPMPNTPKVQRRSRKARRRIPSRERTCPACDFRFKQWPSGWDAHAAHRCPGLESEGVEDRKAEYKRRFGDLLNSNS